MLYSKFMNRGYKMSEKEPLNEISESLKQIADSSKEIVDIMRPKPKKPNYTAALGWVFIGAMILYMLYALYKMVARL